MRVYVYVCISDVSMTCASAPSLQISGAGRYFETLIVTFTCQRPSKCWKSQAKNTCKSYQKKLPFAWHMISNGQKHFYHSLGLAFSTNQSPPSENSFHAPPLACILRLFSHSAVSFGMCPSTWCLSSSRSSTWQPLAPQAPLPDEPRSPPYIAVNRKFDGRDA